MKQYCVIYRRGGTENFEWIRLGPYLDHKYAIDVMDEIRRGRRPAMIEDYDLSASIGLPETYDANGRVLERGILNG